MVKNLIATFTTCALSLGIAFAQEPAPVSSPAAATPAPAPLPSDQPAPIEPPVMPQTTGTTSGTATPPVLSGATALPAETAAATTAHTMDFDDDIGVVLRTLARQAKVSLVVSDKLPESKVTMRLENVEPLQAIEIIANSRNLIFEQQKGIYYIKTQEEKAKEPTVSANYTFSYAMAKDITPLLASQLQGGVPPQFDVRTNTIFYRETKSNLDNIKLFLETIDKPTKQVMIEARLVEVTANPKQSYGINWAGVVGSSTNPQTISYGGSTIASGTTSAAVVTGTTGHLVPQDFLRQGSNRGGNGLLNNLGSQFAILSVPAMSATLRLLNEDSDAEFLANPRVVTANNQKATIKITRNQPVPQLNFNEQTATAVFGGFLDKEFGNTLVVTPSINKDNFITLGVQPEISNKVGDATFTFAGATVASPIIDKRTLDSNVLIKSGDTLAIGGLLQDEVTKGRTKVPVLGDVPILGYAFQERLNTRTKRNLLVFVTPTIIKQGYGTGLEDQVNGLNHSGEEYADPNGWRNNAKGAYRLVPTSNRQSAADISKPGTPPTPEKVNYRASATDREQ